MAKDSKIFAQEISKYIDSKDQKRGKKDKKDKSKEKPKPQESSFADFLAKEKQQAAVSSSSSKDNSKKDDGAAFWPLIRQVNVRCSSALASSWSIYRVLPMLMRLGTLLRRTI